jgi:hypothetical protein
MIGVVANPADYPVVEEFFELFKTPWELYRSDRCYDVLLLMGDVPLPRNQVRAVLVYAGRGLACDAGERIEVLARRVDPLMLSYKGTQLPIYDESVTFRGDNDDAALVDEKSHQLAACSRPSPDRTLVRVGYDLFAEVRILLTVGQPIATAGFPTLDLHVAILRDLILACGVPLVEIPPVPAGYRFAACLTHDVDHPHKLDHTMFGFLYRATLGSLIGLMRGRQSLGNMLLNWGAVVKLPLLHLRLVPDPWGEFGRQYSQLEGGARSTFFVIPFGDRAGTDAPRLRASCYGAADIADQMKAIIASGCEIGLHGIDAWLDTSEGRKELEEIRRITGLTQIGVRMHWLFHDEKSPATLEEAGIDFDSTVGYNETIGYRAGTTQVYKPLQARWLLELPLHIMDTALFYPKHLNLSFSEAWEETGKVIDNAVKFGGSMTVNWHDRSIASERLWGDFYSKLIAELAARGAWLASAAQTVAWFRKRRSAVFEFVGQSSDVRVKVCDDRFDDLPELQVKIYRKATQRWSVGLPPLSEVRGAES